MSSFSPVIRVRKLLDKMKQERKSPRLSKRFPTRVGSENAGTGIPSASLYIPSFKKRTSFQEFTGENQFQYLPDEATLYIFSFLDPKDLCHVAQVSKEMCNFAYDDLTWKDLATYDFGIEKPFSICWRQSYALLHDLCEDGVWEGMSKWIEPADCDTEQTTTARLCFAKRARSSRPSTPVKSSPTTIHRVDSQTTTAPVSRSNSGVATHRDALYRIIGSGVTVNAKVPSPFRIEGQRMITDVDGCQVEWNKHFEGHTSIYTGRMDYATRSVTGVIDYSDGNVQWKGQFTFTKIRTRGMKKSLMA